MLKGTNNISAAANATGGPPKGVLVANYIYAPIAWLIFIFGLFGNSLTVIVLRGKRLRQSSTVVYLTVLAIVDILYLVCSLLINLVNHTIVFPRDVRDSFPLCQLASFLNYTLAHLSIWLIVAVTLDRAIWVSQPFRAKSVCTQRNAVITVTGLVILFICLNGHFFFTMKYTVDAGRLRCKPNFFTYKIFPYIDLVLINVLPFTFMLTANACIAWQLRKVKVFNQSRRMKPVVMQHRNSAVLFNAGPTKIEYESNKPSRKCNASRDSFLEPSCCTNGAPSITFTANKTNQSPDRCSSLSAMLVAVNVFFMVTVAPLLMYDIVYFVVDLEYWFDNSENAVTIVFAVERFVYALWYTNFAIHFFLYCLNGPPFRSEVKRLFLSIQCHRCDLEFRRRPKQTQPVITYALTHSHHNSNGDGEKLLETDRHQHSTPIIYENRQPFSHASPSHICNKPSPPSIQLEVNNSVDNHAE